ncbi:hypothetical protein [Peribacillus huizhouensis]|uniref:Uncharacterized protein n=1 Tax=Peribacillus huizhouensis TaxID=1501239 RepID=A0ABR6CWN2_9BACI|nr:hypothetical protein [Peribacillus huizhouensis]MBA9029422.1 hypothetical protein [Peribacillus huizhouensis]
MKIKSKIKKTLKVLISSFFVLLIVMVISTPSKNHLEDWIYDNYGYKCNDYGVCQKDNIEVLNIGQHYRNAGIFMSVERSIGITDSKKGETETIRAIGIFNNIYTMKDNWFWEIVN